MKADQPLPPHFPEGWSWQATLDVNADIVDAFSRFSGDTNSLHRDSAAARSYAYRQRVAHGMIPVSLLSLSAPLNIKDMTLKKISGRFNHPVFVGDTVKLELALISGSDAGQAQTFSYSVRTSSLREAATYGEFTIGPAVVPSEGKEAPGPSLLSSPQTENTLEFVAIAKGMSAEIPFIIAPILLSEWGTLLKKQGSFSALPPDSHSPSLELTATLLVSTLIGMRLPGKQATFLDFNFNFETPLAPLTAYALRGTIDFCSPGNQIIIENIGIYDKNTAHLMQGKATVKMNEPSIPAPAMKDLSTDLGLKGRTVLITGASRGIGATTARLFACHGARVIVNYFNSQAEAEAVVRDITSSGAQAIAVKADVRDPAQIKAMFEQGRRAFGEIDILVNNAVGDFIPVPFQALTWGRVQEDIDIIVKGAFHCCQEAIPSMIKNKQGRIINVVSIATETPPPNQSKYVLAKSALAGLTRALAVELAGHNILVNMVMPGMVETDLTRTIPQAVRDKMKNYIPLGRHTSTTDVAKAIVTLASSLTPFTTGQKTLITGGLPPYI
ncbi:MAG: SDR family oxidoreductase [Candidatus Omnitrophota bacterium]